MPFRAHHSQHVREQESGEARGASASRGDHGEVDMTASGTVESAVPIPGYPFPVTASPGLEGRARKIAAPCARAYAFLADILGAHPAVSLSVLSQQDWPRGGPPYGLPHYQDGRLVVAGQDADFWAMFIPLVRQAPPEVQAWAVGVYGGSLDLAPFFDLLVIHELGHAFHGETRFPRRWLEELFANLCLHCYVAIADVERLPILETFPQVIAPLAPGAFEHRTLDDFESVYSGMDPVNYGWYQCRLHVAAKRAYDAGGAAVLARLWRRFAPSDSQLCESLRTEVHPELAKTVSSWPQA